MIKVNSDGEPNEVIVLGADSSALLAALKAEQYAAEALASKISIHAPLAGCDMRRSSPI